jgi:hypothetical protein
VASNKQQKYQFYPLSSPEGRAAWAAYNSSPQGRAADAESYSQHFGSGYNPYGVSSADQIPDGLLTNGMKGTAADRAVREYMVNHTPSTLNPQPSTLNPDPYNLPPQPSALNPEP